MQSPENFGAERPSTPQPVAPQPAPVYNQPTYNQPMQPYQSPLPNPTGAFEAPRVAGKRVLRKIDVGSAFKVGAVTYALMWAVLGLPFILLMGAVGTAMQQMGARGAGGAAFTGGGIMGYIFGIALYGLLGGIGSAIAAFVYNLASGWMGGLEIEVE